MRVHPLGGTFPTEIRTTMMKLRAVLARIWSAVTCHRFCRFGDVSPKRGRVQRPGRVGRLSALDGDKSPAESADKSAHSKVVAAPPRWAIRGQIVLDRFALALGRQSTSRLYGERSW